MASPLEHAKRYLVVENTPFEDHGSQQLQLSDSTAVVTVAVLDLRLQSLLQDLIHNIAKEVGKIVHELRGEIYLFGGTHRHFRKQI